MPADIRTVESAEVDSGALAELEQHRRELTGYCYRMLGSIFEAEDAVQETMIRAWRGIGNFEGRSAVRTWLHRIATNVCLDMLRGRQRRALPIGLVPRYDEVSALGPMLPESRWVMPVPDARVLPDTADPAELAASRETIHLAFVAALQYLPARQRAVLILREVLGWSAAEVAVLLDTTVASVTSALQRARSTMAVRDTAVAPRRLDDAVERELLAGYVDAFERYDVARLTALLHNDATQSMAPYPLWVQGPGAIGRWMLGPGIKCRCSRLVPTEANGRPALAQYRSDGFGGHVPFAVHILGIDGTLVREIHTFVVPELFTAFGLPSALAAMDPLPIGR